MVAAVVALVKDADISTTHTRDTMTLAHLATALVDVSTVEERVNKRHIKS